MTTGVYDAQNMLLLCIETVDRFTYVQRYHHIKLGQWRRFSLHFVFCGHVGSASGKLSVEIWRDFLECVGAVVDSKVDEHVRANRIQSLSSSQVRVACCVVIGRHSQMCRWYFQPSGLSED